MLKKRIARIDEELEAAEVKEGDKLVKKDEEGEKKEVEGKHKFIGKKEKKREVKGKSN